MTICRSVEEVRAAAAARDDPPLSQDEADLTAAILAPAQATQAA
jgi:hypothetical protein